MNLNHPLPLAYGIRHSKWRPNQYEAIKSISTSKKQQVVLDAPTGSGKSSCGIALAKELGNIRIVTKSRSLQDQYSNNTYQGEVLYGLGAYPCALIPGANASECVYSASMKDCPRAGSCEYLRAKTKMLESNKQVISYAYWFTAGWLQNEKYDSSIFFDEAHEIPQTTMSFLEKDFNRKWADWLRVRLPKLPDTDKQIILILTLRNWLRGVLFTLEERYEIMAKEGVGKEPTDKVLKLLMVLGNEISELKRIEEQLTLRPEEMFVIVRDDHDFSISPLSARMFRGFLNKHFYEKAGFASATIGDPAVFMGGIGYRKDEWDYVGIPSQFTPESMPVYVPPGSPKIGYASSNEALQKQAEIIHKIISDAPESWSGFIHTASKAQTESLMNRLIAIGGNLPGRVWQPTPGSSSGKIQEWEMQKLKTPNTIALSWDFWTGLDAGDEEINIIAKVPFGTLDVLGNARMNHDKLFYNWEAACKVEQAAGRHRRGEPAHYEVQGQPTRRICAVVDANLYRVYNQFSPLFRKRIEAVRGLDVQISR